MALSFIGKPISLISHSDVRYRGILAGIDPVASTIQLSNVYSMGTESRRPPAEFIPPVQEPYQYIIFRASEVKDLAVDEPAPRRSVHDDPAVLGAGAPAPNGGSYGQYGAPQYPGASVPQVPPQQQNNYTHQSSAGAAPQHEHSSQQPSGVAAPGAPERTASNTSANNNRRKNSVHTAAASLETVERAIGDLRVSEGSGRGGRRGGGGREIKAGEIKVPATDFDFQSSNARFDKAALAPKKQNSRNGDEDSADAEEDESGKSKSKDKEKDAGAYNPQKSFFDSLSSSALSQPSGTEGRGRGGRRGGGRSRREEEREKNVATFGEPGGVGLMGPGAYVGGYGRRGGRPRRGNPASGGR